MSIEEPGEVDVIVVGSGGAGLVAALAAAAGGATVTVIERTPYVGGTTAISGGLVWVANNHHMREEGIDDSLDDALTYVRRLASGRRSDDIITDILESGPAMVEFLEAESELRFETLDKPDYHPEYAGALPAGRCLAPLPLHGPSLGPWLDKLRPGSGFSIPLSWRELDSMNGVFHPERLDFQLIADRAAAGYLGMGRALIGWMLKELISRGVTILTDTRARTLLTDERKVTGVEATTADGQLVRINARRAVVLSSGGFEWNEKLCAQFVAGPVSHPVSCPSSDGDAVRMGMAIGADLANMWDLWRFPSAAIPGEEYDGHPLSRMVTGERALPGAILVNAAGRRFVNEAHPYTDVGRVFMTWDPVNSRYENWPAWAIFDSRFRAVYSVLSLMPSDKDPDWLYRADDLTELAGMLDIDPSELSATVAHFDAMVAAGRDSDFRRGDSLFDQYYADYGNEPSPTLGPINTPPFYALPVYPGAIGSSGGLLTDSLGRVLHVDGSPLRNLFAAGDAAASCFGPGYPGPGGPLGLGMTLGFRAGSYAAGTLS